MDLIAFNVALGLRSSCTFFLERIGGSFEGSNAGARTWYSDPPLEVPLIFVFAEPTEVIVDTDSAESRRLRLCSDDLRGGRLGGPWALERGGGRGGSEGATFGGCGDGSLGRLPISRKELVALERSGGLLTVCPRCCPAGRAGGGGGGAFFFAAVCS